MDRVANYFQSLQKSRSLDALEKARLCFDLVIPSVLLDAGSGPGWKWLEPITQQTIARSEGLAVASFYLFKEGTLTGSRESLSRFTEQKLIEGFQVSAENPLAGVSTRAALIRRLAHAIECFPEAFPGEPRLGSLVDFFHSQARHRKLKASFILRTLLRVFSKTWPTRVNIEGTGFGDVWNYSPLGIQIPFHKLSQWLTYSLIEPLEESGLTITDLDDLTGLPEYRNGGLFLDTEVLVPKNSQTMKAIHRPSDEWVIEWRALTVALLDRLALEVRKQLNKTAEELPLAKILQGGTWSAGREIAMEKRPPQGGPPISIESDGTVF
jgi:hypothetical protein